MLSKKELAIITFLIHHKEQFVSSATLAEVIGMSDVRLGNTSKN